MAKLKEGDKIKVIGLNCGRICKKKLIHLGISEGKELEIITMQPLRGPVIVVFGHSKNDVFSIGRGMFEKIEYEVL